MLCEIKECATGLVEFEAKGRRWAMCIYLSHKRPECKLAQWGSKTEQDGWRTSPGPLCANQKRLEKGRVDPLAVTLNESNETE